MSTRGFNLVLIRVNGVLIRLHSGSYRQVLGNSPLFEAGAGDRLHLGFCPQARSSFCLGGGGATLGFLIHSFWAGWESPIFGVWAAPADPKTIPEGWGLRPPPYGMVFGAAGAAQTPTN